MTLVFWVYLSLGCVIFTGTVLDAILKPRETNRNDIHSLSSVCTGMEVTEPGTPNNQRLETDLDYCSRPENYAGSDLTTLQRLLYARDKDQHGARKTLTKKKRKKELENHTGYRHIPSDVRSARSPGSSDDADSEFENESRAGLQFRTIPVHSSSVSRLPSLPTSGFSRAAKGRSTGGHGLQGKLFLTDKQSSFGRNSVSYKSLPRSKGRTLTPLEHRLSTKPGSRCSDASSESGILGCEGSPQGHDVTHQAPSGHSRRGLSRTLAKNKLSPLSADVTRKQIKKRFQQAIKAVMTIRRLATLMIKKSEEPSAMLKTFTDLIDLSDNFNENLKNQGLSFDPSYFKANKEISVSNEVKSILSMPPSFRSHEQIQTAIYGLQSLQSFAEYPLHMQEKLAKVAWYEVVPPKRTIIRQGHYAENFYFILSGQVVVTILIRDQKTGESHVRTANFMRKGTSFGELALLHHSRRTATVTSHDTVQLLSIGRDDFFDIFMARHGMDDVPEHIRFVSQLDFLKGWPIDRLLEHPEYCLLHFFKRNMVIVKDSKQSDWIYIVKSGSCQVLKQLQGVTARLGTHRYVAPEDDIFRLPHTGTALRGPKIDTGIRRRRKKSDRVRLLPFYRSEDGDQRRQNGMRLPRLAESEGSGLLVTRRSQLPPIDHLLQQSASSSDPPKLGQFSKKNYVETPKTGKVHFRALAARDPKAPDNDSSPLKGQQSLATNNTSTSSLPLADPPSQQPPVFVQVSILKPRDIFGLEVILFPDELETPQTSVSLVSLGAECIMLSKDFFRKHATDFVKKNLQEIVRLYPDEETFQDSLQRKADWDLYKQTLINDLTSAQVV